MGVLCIAQLRNEQSRHGSISYGTQRNLKLAFRLNLHARTCELTKPEPNLKIKFQIDIKNPTSLIFLEILHLIVIQHRHVNPRENPVHVIRAFRTLEERILQRHHLRGRKPYALVEHVRLYGVVVDVELRVGVSCREVEDEVVTKGVVVGGVVELRKRRVAHDEPEGTWLDHDPEDDEYNNDEDHDCKDKLPEEAEEEGAAAICSAVVSWRLRWRNPMAVIRTV
ncbi:unnamed protein product [Sphenostylis stenocarpa]|uniref:Uncharacterized protein n=1 Tax=Sphenostylis stenocarpa TaxID=92480 RepID=A0AA86VLJ1_9FABA|nr:unnamed protein product [Sphenostylis stenocarpa]